MNTNTNDADGVNNEQQNGLTRRSLMRKIGAGTATVAVASAGGEYVAPRYSPIGRASAIAPLIVAAAAGGALLGAGGAYVAFGSGEQVDPEDVRGAEADNIHQSAYSSASALYSADAGFTNELLNNIAPGAPDKGVLASQLTGYLRRRTYEALVQGNTASSAKTAIQGNIDQHVAERKKNLAKQWNEYALEMMRVFWILEVEGFANDQLDPANGVYAQVYDRDDTPLSASSTFQDYFLVADTSVDGWRDELPSPSECLGTATLKLDNGDEFDVNTVPVNPTDDLGGTGTENHVMSFHPFGAWDVASSEKAFEEYPTDSWYDSSMDGGSFYPIGTTDATPGTGILDPFDSTDHQPWFDAEGWYKTMYTLHNYPDQIRQEVSAYVDNAFNQYEAGTLDPADLMESDDWVKQYTDGDAENATTSAVVAEYISMGYMPPDSGRTVEVNATGTDLSEGVLLLNWDFEKVPSWEYDASNYPEITYRNQLLGQGTLTFTVGSDSMDSTQDVTVQASDVEGIGDVDPGQSSVTFDVTTIDDTAPTSGYVDSVSRSPEGAATAWIDEGTTVDASQYVTAVLVEQTEGTPRRAHLGDGFELVNVEGADRYEATRYFSRSRDVTRTKTDVDRETEGYTRSDEIIVEVSVGDILGGALPDSLNLGDNAALAVGGGLVALLLAAAGLSGGDR